MSRPRSCPSQGLLLQKSLKRKANHSTLALPPRGRTAAGLMRGRLACGGGATLAVESHVTSKLEAVYIVSAVRTPIGAFMGSLAELPAPRLGAVAIRAAIERAKLTPDAIGEVFMGNVLSAGI